LSIIERDLCIAADQGQLACCVKAHVSLSVEHTLFSIFFFVFKIACKVCCLCSECYIHMNDRNILYGSLLHFQESVSLIKFCKFGKSNWNSWVSHRMPHTVPEYCTVTVYFVHALCSVWFLQVVGSETHSLLPCQDTCDYLLFS
jgi:hypothetical protein